MKNLRLLALFLGAALIFVEVWRSLGTDRPMTDWMDEQLVGIMLIASGLMMGKDTTRRRAFFATSWGLAAGVLYQNLFGKIADPTGIMAGNFTPGQIFIFVTIAFVASVVGLVGSIMHPRVV